jgi:hypothetical protein
VDVVEGLVEVSVATALAPMVILLHECDKMRHAQKVHQGKDEQVSAHLTTGKAGMFVSSWPSWLFYEELDQGALLLLIDDI